MAFLRVLEGFRASLASSPALPTRLLLALLGASLTILGLSWNHFWPSWGRVEVVLGSTNQPIMIGCFPGGHFGVCWGHVGPFWAIFGYGALTGLVKSWARASLGFRLSAYEVRTQY